MTPRVRSLVGCTAIVLTLLSAGVGTALAGFSGTDVFIPSVGRRSGASGSNWYTTVWVYNPNTATVNVQFSFLERDRINLTPLIFNDSIPPGDTRRYENAIATMFAVEKFGALRVVSSQRVVVNSRVYSQSLDELPRDSIGQFFAGVPASFAIGAGEKTELLGVYQTSPKADSEFRYNFGFVETTGNSATVRVTAREETGTVIAAKDYPMRQFEARQFTLDDLLPGADAENLFLEVEVMAGLGKIVAFGSGLANRSNDPSTFEMSFRDELLLSGQALTAVAHDGSFTGSGTSMLPLGLADSGVASRHLADDSVTGDKIAQGQVVRGINSITDDVTLAAGENIAITPSGGTLTIAATGSASSPSGCTQCDADHIFRVNVEFGSRLLTAFTVPAGKTRYITSLRLLVDCDAGGTARVGVGNTQALYLRHIWPTWDSGGGAPIVIRGGESFNLKLESVDEYCGANMSIFGFEY